MGNIPGRIETIAVSTARGTRKHCVSQAEVRENWGIVGDAHAGSRDRQVSLLAEESIEKMRAMGMDVMPGDFAENMTVSGINMKEVKVKDRLILNVDVVLEVSQIGKKCHDSCDIKEKFGKCIMPDEGIFARVIRGGVIKIGNSVKREVGD